MKKLTIAFLSIILGLSLVACGGTAEPDQSDVADDEAVETEFETDEVELQKDMEENEVYIEEEEEGEYCIMGYGSGAVYSNKDKKYGALNSRGELAVPCEYDYVRGYSFEVDGQKYIRYFVKKDGAYGVMDEDGKATMPVEYAFIDQGLINETGDYPGRVLRARKGEGDPYVYISAIDGKALDENEYKAAMSEAAAAVEEKDKELNEDWDKVEDVPDAETLDSLAMYTLKKDGKLALFTYSGKQLTDYKYTEIRENGDGKYSYHYLDCYVKVKDDDGDRYGVLNGSGKEIAPCGSYINIDEVFDGLVAVQKEEGGLFALAVEKDGSLEVITDFIYNTEHQTC